MMQRGRVRPLFAVALLVTASLAASEAWAGCKFYEICGFTPGAPVASVTSSNTGCISVDMVAANVDNRGCVTFRACCENIIFECKSDILVKVNGPGGLESKISSDWKCAGCFSKLGAPPSDFPDPPCISDVCSAGGDDPGSPIDATTCSTTVAVESKSWSLIKVLYKE